jgi:hypothetical protein
VVAVETVLWFPKNVRRRLEGDPNAEEPRAPS